MIDQKSQEAAMTDQIKLTVQLKNESPVALLDFTNSFLGLADEYGRYARHHEPQAVVRDAQLYVREVKSGSIIVDLVALSPMALPFIEHANSIIKFGEFIWKIYGFLLGRDGENPGLKKKDLENVIDIMEPIAKDSSSQIHYQTVIDGGVHNHYYFNSVEANAIQNAARREIAAMKEPVTGIHRNVLLYFFQVRDDTKSAVGDRGIIERISPFPVKVRFQTEEIKSHVLHADENPFHFAYLIDVAVETIEDKPIVYNVMAVHETIERPHSG